MLLHLGLTGVLTIFSQLTSLSLSLSLLSLSAKISVDSAPNSTSGFICSVPLYVSESTAAQRQKGAEMSHVRCRSGSVFWNTALLAAAAMQSKRHIHWRIQQRIKIFSKPRSMVKLKTLNAKMIFISAFKVILKVNLKIEERVLYIVPKLRQQVYQMVSSDSVPR